jgi:hypothetical protein
LAGPRKCYWRKFDGALQRIVLFQQKLPKIIVLTMSYYRPISALKMSKIFTPPLYIFKSRVTHYSFLCYFNVVYITGLKIMTKYTTWKMNLFTPALYNILSGHTRSIFPVSQIVNNLILWKASNVSCTQCWSS